MPVGAPKASPGTSANFRFFRRSLQKFVDVPTR